MSEYVRPRQPDDWDACPTPDCDNNVCLWGGEGYCHPCSVRRVGAAEMDRRYRMTRVSATDLRWDGSPFLGPQGGGA